jgi:hypothetical protein
MVAERFEIDYAEDPDFEREDGGDGADGSGAR